MSRGIPPVRNWRVRAYADGRLIMDTVVATINKRFARWLANERNGYCLINADRVSITLCNERKVS